MYAIVRTGGKQYKVQKDDVIRVEKMDVEAGDKVTLDDILLFSDGKTSTLGDKVKAKVTAEVIANDRDKKVIIFKKRRRQNSRRKNGHRQHKTVLRITDIKSA
ncbi:MAG: 50S ribosomal protein L21 [Micavibrio sp.]|nr:50S ribosomal protein L21 [Micavibrio sp.]|tara:strand:+ start:824 stop:1132 length:309 start_codon:yes stop_codon:yes gene_type:complete